MESKHNDVTIKHEVKTILDNIFGFVDKYKITNDQVKSLLEINFGINQADSFGEAGKIVFDGLQRFQPYKESGFKLAVYFEDEDLYEIVFYKHHQKRGLKLKSRLNEVDLFSKIAIEKRKTVLIKNSYSKSALKVDPDLKDMENRAMIFIPLFHEDKLVGLFSYAKMTSNSIDTQLKYFLELVGKILSIVIAMRLRQIKDRKQTEEKIIQKDLTIISLKKKLTKNYTFDDIITENPFMKRIIHDLKNFSGYDLPILLEGSSGTGRFASAIHQYSPSKGKPFLPVNCGAITPDLIESELFGHRKGSFTGAIDDNAGKFFYAAGGTVFLDEIAEIPLNLQVKLLRVIDNSEIQRIGENKIVKIDVRIIAATNNNLYKLVKEEKFREDLYQRLNCCKILLPGLNERKDDIPLLIKYFIDKCNTEFGIDIQGVSGEVLEKMQNYDFPGNVRELKNIITVASIRCKKGLICIKHLDGDIFRSNNSFHLNKIKYGRMSEEDEKERIIAIMEKNKGNQTTAAKELNINRDTLRRKLGKFGLYR